MGMQIKQSQIELKRILLVFKSSKLDRYRDDGSLFARRDSSDEDVSLVYERLTHAHEEHEDSLARAEAMFSRMGIEVLRATQPTKADVAKVDLVVTLGGDGTFLWTARKVSSVPMLGVNTAPGASTGHYCGATVDTLTEMLDGIQTRATVPEALTRLSFTINGNRTPYCALNDAFFAHRSPAASSRYLMRIGEHRELQVSSGVWLATQSGSTGAIASAGGDEMEIGDDRIQYLVTSPYRRTGATCELRHGYAAGPIKMVSRSPNNALYLDGPTLSYRLDFGSVLLVDTDPSPLMVYGYSRSASNETLA